MQYLYLRSAAALAYAILSAAVDAKMVRWGADYEERNWLPARRTIEVQPVLGMSPMPTQPPLLPPRELLDKRSPTNNTCGYISGSSAYPLYCDTNSGCVFHTIRKAFGCCPDQPTGTANICEAWTTCLPSSEISRFTSDDGLTLWCGQPAYPSCFRHTFVEASLSGYSIWGCAKTAGSGQVFNRATDMTSSSHSLSVSSSSTSPRTTTSKTSSSSSDPVAVTGPQGADATSPSDSGSAQRQQDSSGPPIGAIVGGSVGGFAVLALLGFAIFFLVRRSKRTGAEHPLNQQQQQQPPNMASPPQSNGQFPPPQMQQQQGQYGFPPVIAAGAVPPPGATDPRASIAKPPYGVTTSVYDPNSPPHSPSPPYPFGVGNNASPSPPPPQQQQQAYGGAPWGGPPQQQYNAAAASAGYSPPPQGYQQYQQHQPASELPIARGDGELRELA